MTAKFLDYRLYFLVLSVKARKNINFYNIILRNVFLEIHPLTNAIYMNPGIELIFNCLLLFFIVLINIISS